MIEALINKLIKEGKLTEQKAGIVQVETLLKESIIDLWSYGDTTLRSSGDTTL